MLQIQISFTGQRQRPDAVGFADRENLYYILLRAFNSIKGVPVIDAGSGTVKSVEFLMEMNDLERLLPES